MFLKIELPKEKRTASTDKYHGVHIMDSSVIYSVWMQSFLISRQDRIDYLFHFLDDIGRSIPGLACSDSFIDHQQSRQLWNKL